MVAVRAALARVQAGQGPLRSADRGPGRGWQPLVRQAQRAIDWSEDGTSTVLRKIRSGDGFPGVEDFLCERRFRLFDARPEPTLSGPPGMLIARRHGAICRATRDGAVWIGELEPITDSRRSFKRPAVVALGALAEALPLSDDDPTEERAARGRRGRGDPL